MTRRILEMERAHDVKLLERNSRNVILTEPGKVLMSYVERMVALADEADVALKSIAGLKTGRIEIGTSRPVANAYLSAIAVAFKHRFPGVVPVIHVENSLWILEQVLGLHLDLGIIGIKAFIGLVEAFLLVLEFGEVLGSHRLKRSGAVCPTAPHRRVSSRRCRHGDRFGFAPGRDQPSFGWGEPPRFRASECQADAGIVSPKQRIIDARLGVLPG